MTSNPPAVSRPPIDDAAAFPTLDAAAIAFLDALGERRRVGVGDFLYRAGDDVYDFFVIISGAVDIVVGEGESDERVVTTQHGAGRFLGELSLLTGQRVYVSARVTEAGEVLRVRADVIRQAIATDARLGDTILTAFMARRNALLTGASSSLRLVGSRYRSETHAVREFLTRSRIPHEWLDPEDSAAANELIAYLEIAQADLPVVVASSMVVRQATPATVAAYLGLDLGRLPDRHFDLVIVGGGPAGLAAAVYGASEGLLTLGIDTIAPGGQAGTSSRIENYLGFPTGISGADLTQRALVQAEKFGAYLRSPCAATSLSEKAGQLLVGLADESEVVGRAVIVATGANYRRLDVDRLDDFEGNGIYYAATDNELRECGTAPVVVVGGGNSAGQAAMFLADNGNNVTMVVRKPDLKGSMSRYLVDRIDAQPNIDVRVNSTISAIGGDAVLHEVRVADASGESVLHCGALFSFMGADPATGWLAGTAALDEDGFVLTDRSLAAEHLDERWQHMTRQPLPYETSHPGLFAVGDVRSGSTKRVAAAVGEGSAAVRSVQEFLSFAR